MRRHGGGACRMLAVCLRYASRMPTSAIYSPDRDSTLSTSPCSQGVQQMPTMYYDRGSTHYEQGHMQKYYIYVRELKLVRLLEMEMLEMKIEMLESSLSLAGCVVECEAVNSHLRHVPVPPFRIMFCHVLFVPTVSPDSVRTPMYFCA